MLMEEAVPPSKRTSSPTWLLVRAIHQKWYVIYKPAAIYYTLQKNHEQDGSNA